MFLPGTLFAEPSGSQALFNYPVLADKTGVGQNTSAMKINLPRPYKIIEVVVENAYTKTFVLNGRLEAVPGQFVMAWLPGQPDKPFSLAGADPIRLTIANVGPFSRVLHQLTPGEAIWLRGPLGNGYRLSAERSTAPHALLIGGGYGVAPLLFLATRALQLGQHVSMIIGARRAADLLLVEAFRASSIPLWLTTEDGSVGIHGRVTDAMPLVLAQSSRRPTTIYSCGPTAMLQAIAAVGQAEQIPVQLAWEAHMRCGLGLCGSCEVGEGWLTCLDGPVFAFDPKRTAPAHVEPNPYQT